MAAAAEQLADAMVVADKGGHPHWWWIVRLLRLMLDDLDQASPWRVLPPFFGPEPPEQFHDYVRLLAFERRSVAELWTSQRAALPLALAGNAGAVINLRTSAGKTRVAELAILQTLLADPEARIFYLAPFRSLALEVEHTLARTLGQLGHGVSHLYGGSRVSSVDTELAAESTITIATPEKTRALFRAAPEVFEKVKLLVIDEGHLLGATERYVRNEVFVDHLRALAQRTGARVLLLSAVLPNAQQLAEWVTGDPAAVVSSPWKPSAERFGFLRWNGERVKIEWLGETASFNPYFVKAEPLGFSRRRKDFPNDKIEAVAASAVRLSAIGPVMIFSGRAVSVPTIAEAVLLALGEHPRDHPWPEHEWTVFEAVCREELDADSLELRAAKAGVICHSNRLTTQVRFAMEHSMRAAPPLIIVATTTLAQGVNVGISSVIISTPYISKETIDKRDFWNICGRAGRAFVDGEGKILYAIDEDPTRDKWRIEKDEALARDYFERETSEPVKSGLIALIAYLRAKAAEAGVAFDLLLQLAADNDFSKLGPSGATFPDFCDVIDDELLALHADTVVNPDDEDPDVWVERVFRGSLAAIQTREPSSRMTVDELLGFLRARAHSAIRRMPDAATRRAVVSSGLPLAVALRANRDLDLFREIADALIADPTAVGAAVRRVEEWARANAASIVSLPHAALLDVFRDGWLAGRSLRDLGAVCKRAQELSRDLYGYQLPWLVHAASQQVRSTGETGRADALSRLALLIELGVPNELAARIFLAGVRSRGAAAELSTLDLPYGDSVRDIARSLRDEAFVKTLRPLVSASTAAWLDLLEAAEGRRQRPLPKLAAFRLPNAGAADVLHARRLGEKLFLCSTDARTRIAVRSTDTLPLAEVANDSRVAFVRTSEDRWEMTVRDPRARPR